VLSSTGEAEKGLVNQVLGERFGVPPGALERWRLLASGSVIWAVREDGALDEALHALRIERTGLPLLRRVGRHWKPTTVALQALGHQITRSIVDLDASDVERLLTEGSIIGTRSGLEEGYVAVRGPQGVLGCCLYLDPLPEEGKPEGLLRSQLPRAHWERLGRHLREET
jgi:hypothetical protein